MLSTCYICQKERCSCAYCYMQTVWLYEACEGEGESEGGKDTDMQTYAKRGKDICGEGRGELLMIGCFGKTVVSSWLWDRIINEACARNRIPASRFVDRSVKSLLPQGYRTGCPRYIGGGGGEKMGSTEPATSAYRLRNCYGIWAASRHVGSGGATAPLGKNRSALHPLEDEAIICLSGFLKIR